MYTLPRIRIFRNIKIILEVSCVRESPMKEEYHRYNGTENENVSRETI